MTKVIFRRYRNGDIIALFPTLAGTNDPSTCLSYMHVGQHSAADQTIVRGTRLATADERAPLLAELRRIYDDLVIVSRFTYADYLQRLSQIKRI